jgi:hypothetical protein
MDTQLAIQLSEHAFTLLSEQATAAGTTPAEMAKIVVERALSDERRPRSKASTARADFESCFGSVDTGRAIGVENDAIDADLAREYGNATGSA